MSRIAVAFVAAAVLAAAPAHAARAQDVIDAKSAAHIRDEYLADLDTVHAKVMALANAIPADRYSWRPGQGVRSVSEALMHIASEWYVYAPMSVGAKPPANFTNLREQLPALEKIVDKDAVIAELNKSWAHCQAQLKAADASRLTTAYKPWGIPLDRASYVMAGDLHEHLGQMIAYARSVGVKPPWTK